MNPRHLEDLSNLSMLELFRVEAENQTGILTSGLLELERGSPAGAGPQLLEMLMRAAHSLKGAARIVNLPPIVQMAHAMEDCFVAAQQGALQLRQPQIDVLLRGVDLLLKLSKQNDPANSKADPPAEIKSFLDSLGKFLPAHTTGVAAHVAAEVTRRRSPSKTPQSTPTHASPAPATAKKPLQSQPNPSPDDSPPLPPSGIARSAPISGPETSASAARAPATSIHEAQERVVRLNAENLNRLLGLAGESLVESRWLRPFADSLQRLKRRHTELSEKLDDLRQTFRDQIPQGGTPHPALREDQLNDLFHSVSDCQQFLSQRIEELDVFDRRSAHLSHRLYLEVLRTRMRPFSDGVRRFPRMVRDLARSLGKEVRLEIEGENTQVDRDILERLETPLAHLLRNAVDHGCETPAQRRRAGKPSECCISLDAHHSAGMLVVTVADDGAGIDLENLRRLIVQKKLTMPAVAEKFSEPELIQFLFLPGFTVKETVTEISGRGVGLDVVQNMVKSVRGTIRLTTQPREGLRIQLQLPLTLSVLRALLVEVANEPYAIPLTQITRTLKLPRQQIESVEGRHHFRFGDQPVGLLTAQQVLDCAPSRRGGFGAAELSVVVLGDRSARYGLIVDRFLGERELVVQPLDPRLGKVKDISAAALMEDGSPVLIVDVEDLLRSTEKLISAGVLVPQGGPAPAAAGPRRDDGLEASAFRQKRVLAADDSLTVRELERKLLTSRGYHADVAVDGMDAWNAVRSGNYDLILTDVDMPRMDGIELTRLIKNDPRLKLTPVIIVSYKDNEQDRLRGLEAGADYYLTKGSFQDETLLQAVLDLIGPPSEVTLTKESQPDS